MKRLCMNLALLITSPHHLNSSFPSLSHLLNEWMSVCLPFPSFLSAAWLLLSLTYHWGVPDDALLANSWGAGTGGNLVPTTLQKRPHPGSEATTYSLQWRNWCHCWMEPRDPNSRHWVLASIHLSALLTPPQLLFLHSLFWHLSLGFMMLPELGSPSSFLSAFLFLSQLLFLPS